MKNLSSGNLSSSLNINVLGGNLKSTEEAKLESILERIEDHIFNKKLIEGDSLLKIKEFFLNLEQEPSKAEGNLKLLNDFIQEHIKEFPKDFKSEACKTSIAYIFFAYQKNLSVQMVSKFIEIPYIEKKIRNKAFLVGLFLSNPDNKKEDIFSFLLKNLTFDNFTKDSGSRKVIINNFANNPLYQEELQKIFIGSDIIKSKELYYKFFEEFEENYKNDRQENLDKKDFPTIDKYIEAVIASNKSNQDILDMAYLSGKYYNEMNVEGVFSIDSAASNMKIMSKVALIQNLDEIIKASTGCQAQDLDDCVKLERDCKEQDINYTLIVKKSSISSKDSLIIDFNENIDNANFADQFKLVVEAYKPSKHGAKIILRKIKPIDQVIIDISFADFGEINLDNQDLQKKQIKKRVNDFNQITFINCRVAINQVPKNLNCEDLILLFKNSDHKEPVVIIDDTATQLKQIKEIIDSPFENVKNKKVKLDVDESLINKKLAYILDNNDDKEELNTVFARIFGNDYSIEKLKIDTNFDDKKFNEDVPYNQISNINVSSKKLSVEQVARN